MDRRGQATRAHRKPEPVVLGAKLELARTLGEKTGDRSHRQVRSDVTCLMTAGAVGHDVKLQIVPHQRDVLVVVAAPPHVGLGSCLEHEIARLRARGFAHKEASLTRAARKFRW